MDPLGLIPLLVGAGWLIGKLPGKKDLKPSNSLTTSNNSILIKSSLEVKNKNYLTDIEVLPEYKLVHYLVSNQFPIIYVTGGAGTGKSTFINWLASKHEGHVLIGAPTGIAAINVNGKTLHSLCMLPPAWVLETDIKEYKPSIAKAAKLLIIDEISMVNANILDAVNAFFQKNRRDPAPFGGLPVVMVGDLFQLPPVINNNVRQLFSNTYKTAKFYGAKSLETSPFYAVELKKAFRQVDQEFIDVLGKIREGVNLESALNILNLNCKITDIPPAGAVWLSPRNFEVDKRNKTELLALPGPSSEYQGLLTGKFKDDRLPAPLLLELRIGAQVLFTKNGVKWVNGSIGHIEKLLPDKVHIRLSDTNEVVEVSRENWKQYDYKLNPATNSIERLEVGQYFQLPLILAWSITIHKSQGRTIEKVHIDLGSGAFETGQTYVALSRCRSIKSLTLSRPLLAGDVRVDPEAQDFYRHLRELIQSLPPEKIREKIGLVEEDD